METKQIEILQKKDRMPTVNLVRFNILTCGIFSVVYFWKNTPLIAEKINKKLPSQGFMLAIVLCLGVSFLAKSIGNSVFSFTSGYGYYGSSPFTTASLFSAVSNLLIFAYYILWIIWSFKMVDCIQEYAKDNNIELKTNKLWAFFCYAYYVNYKINEISEK